MHELELLHQITNLPLRAFDMTGFSVFSTAGSFEDSPSFIEGTLRRQKNFYFARKVFCRIELYVVMGPFSRDSSRGRVFNDESLYYIEQLLELILRDHRFFFRYEGPSTVIARVLEEIHHSFEENIDFDALAERHKISRTYLSTLFKREVGMTPSAYVNVLRVGKAKNLLHHSKVSIAALARSLGYRSANYFSRVFKDLMGMSPTEYRSLYGDTSSEDIKKRLRESIR